MSGDSVFHRKKPVDYELTDAPPPGESRLLIIIGVVVVVIIAAVVMWLFNRPPSYTPRAPDVTDSHN